MWSTPVDRDRAAFRARPLTPAQARARGERESCFNAGFDAAVRALIRDVPVNFQHAQYLDDRRQLFDQFDNEREWRKRPTAEKGH